MKTIKNKLRFAFGASIAVLILVMVLNLMYTQKSQGTHLLLKKQIEPIAQILDQFHAFHNELFLLSLNKVAAERDFGNTNRMKIITEVELPNIRKKAVDLFAQFTTNDSKVDRLAKIITLNDQSISMVHHLYDLLPTKNDYLNASKLQKARAMVNDELSPTSTKITNAIAALQMDVNEEYKVYQSELSQQLDNVSSIIFITCGIAILIGFIVAFTTIRAIVRPIQVLKTGAKRISAGEYDYRVTLKGEDELALLGNSFNEMASSLNHSFEAINVKNQELEQFVYITSHDLQEPLRTLNSFTDLLSAQYKGRLDGDADQYIRFIAEASSRMSNLVKGLMDLSRLGKEDTMKKIHCPSLVQNVKDDLASLIMDTHAQITIDDLPEIHGYQAQIRLLFQNLINNAIKFQKPGFLPQIHIYSENEEKYWKFAVRDNGIGIAEQHKRKIFSIFQRLHHRSEFEGTGIGLAHCSKIIALHGGKIWVESELNMGSTFYFTILKPVIRIAS